MIQIIMPSPAGTKKSWSNLFPQVSTCGYGMSPAVQVKKRIFHLFSYGIEHHIYKYVIFAQDRNVKLLF